MEHLHSIGHLLAQMFRDPFTLMGPVSVFLFFLWAFWYAIKTTKKFNNRVINVEKAILDREPRKFIDYQALNQLESIIKSEEFLRDEWDDFSETLVHDEITKEIFSTVRFSQVLRVDNLLDRQASMSFHRKTPMLVTSVGLFFTFFYIVVGLSTINMNGDSTVMLKSINELVSNLSGKFVSSVCGLFFAFILTIVEHNVDRRSRKIVDSLLRKIDRSLRRRPTEGYISSLTRVMEDSSQLLRVEMGDALKSLVAVSGLIEGHTSETRNSMAHFSTDLADVIKNAFERDVSRPLMQALNALQQEKTENQSDLLVKTLDEFRASLTQSAGAEFDSLSKTVAQMASTLQASTNQSAKAAKQIEDLLEAMTQQSDRARGNTDQQIANIQTTFSTLMEGMVQRISEISNLAGHNLKEQSENANNRIGEMSTAVADMGMRVSSMIDHIGSVNQKSVSHFSEISTAITKTAGNLSEQQSALLEKLTTLQESTVDAMRVHRELLKEQEGVLGHYKSTAGTHIAMQEKLLSGQLQLNGTVSALSQRDATVQSSIDTAGQILLKYQTVFQSVETGLGKVLSQLANHINEYNDRTRVGLTTALDKYDSALTTATGKLSSSVEGLSDALDGLDDLVVSISKKKAG